MQGIPNGVDHGIDMPDADEWKEIAQLAMSQRDQAASALHDIQIQIAVLRTRLQRRDARIAELEGKAQRQGGNNETLGDAVHGSGIADDSGTKSSAGSPDRGADGKVDTQHTA